MSKWLTEIRKVGLVDWLWFVVWLGRDEFSIKLDYTGDAKKDVDIANNRQRAHIIDMKLSEGA